LFQTPNLKIEFLSFYLAELSLLDYGCIRFLPSIIAASALFLARFIISPKVHPWVSIYLMDSASCFSLKEEKYSCFEKFKLHHLLQTSSLHEWSGYKPFELKDCVLTLHDLYFSRKAASFRSVRDKYKQCKVKLLHFFCYKILQFSLWQIEWQKVFCVNSSSVWQTCPLLHMYQVITLKIDDAVTIPWQIIILNINLF